MGRGEVQQAQRGDRDADTDRGERGDNRLVAVRHVTQADEADQEEGRDHIGEGDRDGLQPAA